MAKSRIKSTQNHPIANNSAVEDHAIFSLPISTFLQNSNAGILLTDALHRFIWCNEVFLRDADIESAAIIGKPFTAVMQHMGRIMLHPDEFIAKMEDLRKKKKPFQ